MLKNNNFTKDSEGERTERLVALSANIGAVAVELGLPAAKVTEAEAAQTEWDADLSAATREAGEAQEATEELNKAIAAAYEYYVRAKAYLLGVIHEIEYPDKIIVAYGFDVDAPTDYKGLHNSIKTWIDEHAVLSAAGDPRVVNATIIGNLTTHFATLDSYYRSRLDEKDEAIRATETKRATFVRHSKLMLHIYTLACLTWGDDDSRLRLLGFVPASEVWTPGGGGEPSPEIGVPSNLQAVVEGDNVRISWDAVAGADGYYLVHTQFPPLFLRIYEGADTEFLHELPDAGKHHYMVRARVGEAFGDYSAEATAEVVLEAPAPPVLLVMTLVEDNKTKVSWANPSGTYYDGCNLYVAEVPNGSPAPGMPASPMFHDLFVYSITLDSLAAGMTRYVWVTGVRSGVESAPAGPVWVEAL